VAETSGETSCRLGLRVAPGASKTRIVGRHGSGWKVAVAAAPERGRANTAVIELLADTLGLKRGAVSVVSGHTGREKIVELSGLEPDEIDRRLAFASGLAAGKDGT
jgi:uncharacterized protein (TIGR00251 family)